MDDDAVANASWQPAVDRDASARVHWLALGAIGGPLVFDGAAVVTGALRPGYSWVSRPLSALALGPDGRAMRGAFLLYGVLVGLGVVAALASLKDETTSRTRWACTLMLVVPALGSTWAGIFTMAPETLALHNVGAQLAFALPIVLFPITGSLLRQAPRWRRYGTWLILGGPLTLALLVGFICSVPLPQMAEGGGRLGLWQRALAVEVQCWYVALGWLVLTGRARRSATGSATP